MASLNPVFDTTKEARTSGWQNNCGLHCFIHKIIEMLEDPQKKDIWLSDLHYKELLNCFVEYYDLESKMSVPERLEMLGAMLKRYPNPMDQERFLAPVFRIYLQKLLQRESIDKIWESPPKELAHDKAIEYRALSSDFANFLETTTRQYPEINALDKSLDYALSILRNQYAEEIKILIEKSQFPPPSEMGRIVDELTKPGGEARRKPYYELLKNPNMAPHALQEGILLYAAKQRQKSKWREKVCAALGVPANTTSKALKLMLNNEPKFKVYLDERKAIKDLKLTDEQRIEASQEVQKNKADLERLEKMYDRNIQDPVKLIRDEFIKRQWFAMEKEKIKTRYQQKGKELFQKQGHPLYAQNMGDINKGMMTTEFELIQLSDALNIHLEIYRNSYDNDGTPILQRQMQHVPSEVKDRRETPELLKIKHSGAHWQYEASVKDNTDKEKLINHNAGYLKDAAKKLCDTGNPASIKTLVKTEMQSLSATQAPAPSASQPKKIPPLLPSLLTQGNLTPSGSTHLAFSHKISLAEMQSELSKILANKPTVPWRVGGIQKNIQGLDSINISDFSQPNTPIIATVQEDKDKVECNILHKIESDTAKILLQGMINTAQNKNERSIEVMLSTTSIDHLLTLLSAIKELQKEQATIIVHLKIDALTRTTGIQATLVQKKQLSEDYKEILATASKQQEDSVIQFQQAQLAQFQKTGKPKS